MPDVCDHKSVAGVLTDPRGLYLAGERSDGLGWAVCAGHRDPHGTSENAMRAEKKEEFGLTVTKLELLHTMWLPNLCAGKILPGNEGGHEWSIYRTETSDLNVKIDPREISSYAWIDLDRMQRLVDTSLRNMKAGRRLAQWQGPFWEPPQILVCHAIGLVDVSKADREMVTDHCRIHPNDR